MRTTLKIDDDILNAAKAMASQQGKPLGDIISGLARRALQRPQSGASRNGIPLLCPPAQAAPVTLDIVNALRDE
jgi:hypothetical protein